MSNYPEHDKLKDLNKENEILGQFLDWLLHERDPRLSLCTLAKPRWQKRVYKNRRTGDRTLDDTKHTMNPSLWEPTEEYREVVGSEPQWFPISTDIPKLLAEYYGIDLKVLKEEKQRMLDEFRDEVRKDALERREEQRSEVVQATEPAQEETDETD